MTSTNLLATILLSLTLSPQVCAQEKILLMGDSYMVGMQTHLQQLWPFAEVLSKKGARVNAPLWQSGAGFEQYGYVFISLGINDLPSPSELTSGWINHYQTKVSGLVQRFSPNASIFWILPPCPIGQKLTGTAKAQWQYLIYAIKIGLQSSNRAAKSIMPSDDVCRNKRSDGIHFNATSYKEMAFSIFK